MDKFEQLVANARFPVCILGNQRTLDFELVSAVDIESEARIREMQSRGLYFIGTLGIVEGRAQSAFDEELCEPAREIITHAYIAHVLSSIPWLAGPTN